MTEHYPEKSHGEDKDARGNGREEECLRRKVKKGIIYCSSTPKK